LSAPLLPAAIRRSASGHMRADHLLLAVELAGLARLWQIGEQKPRMWPFAY
jgi:hypothetical protein